MKRFVLALVATLALVGCVLAEEFSVTIVSVDAKAGTVSYFKGGGGGFKGGGGKGKGGGVPKTSTLTLAKDCVIAHGVLDYDTKAYKVTKVIDKGLESDSFKTEKGATLKARITIADDGDDKGKATQILLTKGGMARP